MKTRRLVVLLVALGLGALAADWMTRDPGYVLLTWGDYALETSLGIAVLALAVLGASAATMYVSLRGMFGAIRQIIEWTASLSETDTAAKRRQLSQKAQRLLLSGQHGSLRRRLDRALPEIWESELLDCYGLVSDTKPQQRLENAMAWLQDHPDDARLLLCGASTGCLDDPGREDEHGHAASLVRDLRGGAKAFFISTQSGIGAVALPGLACDSCKPFFGPRRRENPPCAAHGRVCGGTGKVATVRRAV